MDKNTLKTLADRKDLYTEIEDVKEACTWCGWCGNYGIQKALIRALTLEDIKPYECLLCYDVGCNGNGSDKIGAYTLHGLHGRVISLASGAALANSEMKVVAMGGDGATFSEGVGHLVHAVRSNYPLVFIHHNNENYALTTGQASGTTRTGQPMNGSPDGVPLDPINPCEIVFTLNPTFVARTFSGDVDHMTKILREALNHNGFAFIDVLQTCPTYNKVTSNEWFWERIKDVEKIKGYNVNDLEQAKKIAQDMENEIAVGILFKNDLPEFSERLPQRQGKKTTLTNEVSPYDISSLIQTFS
jgi:2-oxoglutarate ferredoxin oxidoreductase subunit beta